MKAQQFDAEERLVSIASSIEVDPLSWKDWKALHIIAESEAGDFQDIVVPVKALVESYFKDIEGGTYFCNDKDIYVICQNTPTEVLEQMQTQVYDFVKEQGGQVCESRIYDFAHEARAFSESAFNSIGELFSIHVSTAEGGETEAPKNKGRAKVLLVEDDVVTRAMVENALKDECDISSADTASKVFSMYRSCNPNIVFLDIGLPDNSGNVVLDWIMRNDPSACVIMLSGRSNIDNISGCIEAGAKGFIPKPFVKENLLGYIRQYG